MFKTTSLFVLLFYSAFSIGQHADITVAKDGSGDCLTIAEAMQKLPAFGNGRLVVFIKQGVYEEKFRITKNNVTLMGESREGTIIQYSQLNSDWSKNKDTIGTAMVNIYADDIILKNLTITNTQPEIGPHAFAIFGRGTRTIIDNCTVTSKGADTVSLWDSETGMYYHNNCHFAGAVDFVCPRGWCYIDNSSFYEEKETAAIWHAGGQNKAQKFVIKNSSFDGVQGFHLGRHHYDAQFYLINCSYSENMADKPIYRVTYPDEPERDRPYRWGERKYFYGVKKEGESFEWLNENLQNPDTITAKWTFDYVWNPENNSPPTCVKIEKTEDELIVEFSEDITVRGELKIKNMDGSIFTFKNKKDEKTIIFNGDARSIKTDIFDVINGELLATSATVQERKIKKIQLTKQPAPTTEWLPANLFKEKSNNVKISGQPQLINSHYGEAIYFNGINDALFLNEMPLKLAESFSIEMIFNPERNAPFEQRVVHIGEVSEDRMLLEIRAVDDHWYLDGFVASGSNKKALIDEKLIHPLGQWCHVALVVTPDSLTTYVNGKLELQDAFSFKTIESGKSSIGVRLNERSWFKGSIYKIKITPEELEPDGFMKF